MSEKVSELLRKFDELRSELAALRSEHGPVELSAKEKRDHLVSMYGEIAKYDCHYSTVRTGLTTFLTGVGLLYGVYAVLRESEPFGIVLVFVLYAFALIFNLRFYRMTRACWEMQKRIEDELHDSLGIKALADDATLFRRSISRLLRLGSSDGSGIKFSDKTIDRRPDGLFWTAFWGHVVVVVTLILYCLVFDARCQCRAYNLFSSPAGYGECHVAGEERMLLLAGLPADERGGRSRASPSPDRSAGPAVRDKHRLKTGTGEEGPGAGAARGFRLTGDR